MGVEDRQYYTRFNNITQNNKQLSDKQDAEKYIFNRKIMEGIFGKISRVDSECVNLFAGHPHLP